MDAVTEGGTTKVRTMGIYMPLGPRQRVQDCTTHGGSILVFWEASHLTLGKAAAQLNEHSQIKLHLLVLLHQKGGILLREFDGVLALHMSVRCSGDPHDARYATA